MFEVQRTAARYDRPKAFSARYHGSAKLPNEVPVGFDEIFTNAFLLDAPMLCQHNNDHGWWEIEEKLQMNLAKRLNMESEHYPYEAASTDIGADALKPEAFATLEFIDWARCHLWF
jgi:N-acyl-D-glutamate deacylase